MEAKHKRLIKDTWKALKEFVDLDDGEKFDRLKDELKKTGREFSNEEIVSVLAEPEELAA